MADLAATETFLLVDGENIDATLGGSLLGRRPAPEERPRWDRVRTHALELWDQPVRALFFLNGSTLEPLSGQESHMIVRAGKADALVAIDAGVGEVAAGEEIRYIPIG